ncbi:MAG: zinc-binding alcohol dehydrogenase [Armatimonadetes bacterium]|nr:zinc-binding alcohol dehydrogenase [Armatimonadota bacterium]
MRKAVAIDGRGVISVLEQPIPTPLPGQVLVEMRASAISPGTELGGVRRQRENPRESSPRVFGYGNSGVVIGRGEGTEEEYPLGLRVACMGGGYADHATHCAVPRNMSVPIPDGVSFEQAAFTCLAATALHAIRRGETHLGEYWAVLGLGPVGQFALQLARVAGAHVLGVDRLDNRLQTALAGGAHRVVNNAAEDAPAVAWEFSRGHGFDGAVLAFGGDGTPALNQAYQMMKLAPDTHRYGNIVAVGGVTVQALLAAGLGNVDIRSSARPGPGYHDEAWEHGDEYPPVFVEWTTERNLEECLIFMQQGRLRVDPIITHRGPIDDAPALCDELIEHPERAIGVVLLGG